MLVAPEVSAACHCTFVSVTDCTRSPPGPRRVEELMSRHKNHIELDFKPQSVGFCCDFGGTMTSSLIPVDFVASTPYNFNVDFVHTREVDSLA